MIKKLAFSLLATVAVASVSHAWGGVGHTYVAKLAVDTLPASPLKTLMLLNKDWFAASSSHPDRWRNRPDHAEAGRHFLDGERFGFGSDLSKIPQDFAAVQKISDYMKLRSDGMNPWTVRRVYGLLVMAMREKRWDDAMVQAAYLSHYVGDAHVPFHATENYDGQLSEPSQKGIHARFESVMLEKSVAYSELKPGRISLTKDKDSVATMFSILQASINEVPTILAIDKKASAAAAGDTFSDAYWSAFTPAAKPIAIRRLEMGGAALASLLESAWQEAGRPVPPAGFQAKNSSLPYAPEFTPRGQTPPPFMPVVTDEQKAVARKTAITLHIESEALGKFVPCTVLLPKGYWESGNTKRYPVLYLLHGAFGKHTDWLKNAGTAAYLADLPLIVVLPDSQGDSFYQNSPGFGSWQTYFERELMPEVEGTFRTINKREGRAIAGLSMGGYGSWHLAIDNPTKFCAAASLSGVVEWGEGKPIMNFVQKMFPTNTDTLYTTGAIWPKIAKLMGSKGEWRGPALYFDCGKDDFLIQMNRNMERRLLEKGLPFEFSEFDGAHTWSYWDEHLRDVLNFTMRHVAAPTEK
jgi:S-formylglutathione hydrolase FrmB